MAHAVNTNLMKLISIPTTIILMQYSYIKFCFLGIEVYPTQILCIR